MYIGPYCLPVLQVFRQLRHPCIIQFLGCCLAPPNVCIVEELAEGGSLHQLLQLTSGGARRGKDRIRGVGRDGGAGSEGLSYHKVRGAELPQGEGG